MRKITREIVYWGLSACGVGGSLVAGLAQAWNGTGYGYPHQGLAVALGLVGATFAFLADRAHRRHEPT
jgi:hypothetical protein